jgi:hypothetical protein
LFTFIVGADKEVTLHSAALAGLSQSLNALMDGEMIEAKTRRVDWSDVDVDTFTRLCEFAYLRDYTPPSSRLVNGKFSSPKVRETAKEKRKRKKRHPNVNWDDPITQSELEPTPAPEPESEVPPAEAPEPETV